MYGLGMLEMGISFDLAQLVLDNETAGMIKHVINGIPVNDETLAVDVIREVGIFRDFLAHDDTFKHMRTQSQVELIDRHMREEWEAAGSTTIYQRAREKVKYILENHKPLALPASVRSEIRAIIAGTEEELGVADASKQTDAKSAA